MVAVVGQLMTERIETIGLSSTAQQASKKMRDKNVSSLVVDDDNRPAGIITERDFVKKLYVNDTSGGQLIKDLMSFPLVTADARLSVAAAADKMIQNKVRHLLVVEDVYKNKPLGIITSTDLVTYLKDQNINGANALQERREKHEAIKELEDQGEIPKDVLKGGEIYEDEEPRQGL